jgi:hypothetical protein
MTPPGRRLLVVLLLGLSACRRAEPTRRASPAPGPGAAEPSALPSRARLPTPRPPPADAPHRLPEDPVKARLASEQWDRHLVEEERERKQSFDRAHEREHEALLAAIQQARARYLAARTPSAIRAAQAAFRKARPALEQAVRALDPGGKSSELAPGYAATFALLDGAYPDALSSALSGDRSAAVELGRELDERVKAAHAWLEGEEEDDDDDDAKRERERRRD